MLFGVKLLQFFTGPAGRVVLLALAFVGWTLYQRHDATRDCEAAELLDELTESQRQLEIANQIAEDARGRADNTEREMTVLEGLYGELKRDLVTRPGTSCPIDPDTRERLLRIE